MKLGQSARKHVFSRSVLVVRMSNISVRELCPAPEPAIRSLPCVFVVIMTVAALAWLNEHQSLALRSRLVRLESCKSGSEL